MNTLEFFERVLPHSPLYVLAKKTETSAHHTVYKSLDAMAAAALKMDREGHTVYFARAAFKEGPPPNGRKLPNGQRQPGIRTKKNIRTVRSLSIDLDVKPGVYASAKEAVAALAVFTSKHLLIPFPMLVSSGRGIHAYWAFDADVSEQLATPMAMALAKACQAHGLKHDTSITGNLAGLLRPIGTHWRKEGEREVVLLRDAPVISHTVILAALKPFMLALPNIQDASDREWDFGSGEFPPSSFHEIAKHCGAVQQYAQGSAGIQEPLWRLFLGLIKHTVEGEPFAHQWSSQDPRYNEAHTTDKLDIWQGGPPTCATISLEGGACTGCPHTVKSPIRLGYNEQTPSTPIVVAPPEPIPPANTDWSNKSIADLAPWFPERDYKWSGKLARMVTNDQGVSEPIPFCDTWWYPYARYRSEDGTFAAKVCALGRKGRWRTFDVPTSSFADSSAFAKAMAAQEIFPLTHNGILMMKSYAVDVLRALATHEHETDTISHFGWNDAGFVLGNTLISHHGETPVILGPTIPSEYTNAFTQAGDEMTWVRLIDRIYNRPGAEPYQFMILAGIASPLIQLTQTDMWHGIPIALTGASGLGKTTTCAVACTPYGSPTPFVIHANEEGTSVNALLKTFSMFHNLPLVLDEVHGMKGLALSSILYALSNGCPKRTLKADRTFRDDGLGWNLTSFITSNSRIMDLLAAQAANRAEATQVRVFEISLPADYNSRVFPDINAKEVIDSQLLGKNYGVVGRRFLSQVHKHKDRITQLLQQNRVKYGMGTQDDAKERFYYDLISNVVVGGSIARSMGLVSFDITAIEAWALTQVRELRGIRSEVLTGFHDELASVFAALAERTMHTREYVKGKWPNGKAPEHIDMRGLRDPVARYARDDNLLLVTQTGLKTICAKFNIDYRDFINQANKRGYFRPISWIGATSELIAPFRGTDTPLAPMQTKCVLFNLEAMGEVASVVSNVVQMSAVK